MNANTVEGAKKTALYFIQLYPYVLATGDLKEFDALSVRGKGEANCGSCATFRRSVVELKKNHQSYEGGAIKVSVTRTYARDTLYDGFPLDIAISQGAATIRQKDGSLAKRTEASITNARIELLRAKGGWRVLTIAPRKGKS